MKMIKDREDLIKVLKEAFNAGAAYATASSKDFKQTHLSFEEYVKRYIEEYYDEKE